MAEKEMLTIAVLSGGLGIGFSRFYAGDYRRQYGDGDEHVLYPLGT